MGIAAAIRSATLDDLDQVACVWHESASEMDSAASPMPSLAELRARLDAELAGGWELFVAERAQRIVGILAIKTEEAALDQIFVLPAEQRAGVGSLLLEKAQQAMPNGFSLRMAKGNFRAACFYERAGLECAEEGLHPISGKPVLFYNWNGR